MVMVHDVMVVLLHCCCVVFFGSHVDVSTVFVESLILAQDERWRRA